MLDIGVGDALHQPSDPAEPSLGFEGDDGYYWFLHPLFERLAAETGQYIDLKQPSSTWVVQTSISAACCAPYTKRRSTATRRRAA